MTSGIGQRMTANAMTVDLILTQEKIIIFPLWWTKCKNSGTPQHTVSRIGAEKFNKRSILTLGFNCDKQVYFTVQIK